MLGEVDRSCIDCSKLDQKSAAYSLFVRPDDIVIDKRSKLQARIVSTSFRGTHSGLLLAIAG